MRSSKKRPIFYILNSKFFGKGFSLIELIVAVGIIAIISAVAFATFFTRRGRLDLDSVTRQMVALLREAQSRSVSQESQTSWGVHFENSTGTAPFYALFKTSYSAPNRVNYFRLPSDVSYATSSLAQGSSLEVSFSQISGLPSAAAALTFQLTTGSAVVTSTITVSTSGLVSY